MPACCIEHGTKIDGFGGIACGVACGVLGYVGNPAIIAANHLQAGGTALAPHRLDQNSTVSASSSAASVGLA